MYEYGYCYTLLLEIHSMLQTSSSLKWKHISIIKEEKLEKKTFLPDIKIIKKGVHVYISILPALCQVVKFKVYILFRVIKYIYLLQYHMHCDFMLLNPLFFFI